MTTEIDTIVDGLPKSLNVAGWKGATKHEVGDYLTGVGLLDKDGVKKERTLKGSSDLIVRTGLIPVDIYCYLKARFGEPNGFQNYLRNDDSDNWIHWEYLAHSTPQRRGGGEINGRRPLLG